jgi:hypothetical protein
MGKDDDGSKEKLKIKKKYRKKPDKKLKKTNREKYLRWKEQYLKWKNAQKPVREAIKRKIKDVAKAPRLAYQQVEGDPLLRADPMKLRLEANRFASQQDLTAVGDYRQAYAQLEEIAGRKLHAQALGEKFNDDDALRQAEERVRATRNRLDATTRATFLDRENSKLEQAIVEHGREAEIQAKEVALEAKSKRLNEKLAFTKKTHDTQLEILKTQRETAEMIQKNEEEITDLKLKNLRNDTRHESKRAVVNEPMKHEIAQNTYAVSRLGLKEKKDFEDRQLSDKFDDSVDALTRADANIPILQEIAQMEANLARQKRKAGEAVADQEMRDKQADLTDQRQQLPFRTYRRMQVNADKSALRTEERNYADAIEAQKLADTDAEVTAELAHIRAVGPDRLRIFALENSRRFLQQRSRNRMDRAKAIADLRQAEIENNQMMTSTIPNEERLQELTTQLQDLRQIDRLVRDNGDRTRQVRATTYQLENQRADLEKEMRMKNIGGTVPFISHIGAGGVQRDPRGRMYHELRTDLPNADQRDQEFRDDLRAESRHISAQTSARPSVRPSAQTSVPHSEANSQHMTFFSVPTRPNVVVDPDSRRSVDFFSAPERQSSLGFDPKSQQSMDFIPAPPPRSSPTIRDLDQYVDDTPTKPKPKPTLEYDRMVSFDFPAPGGENRQNQLYSSAETMTDLESNAEDLEKEDETDPASNPPFDPDFGFQNQQFELPAPPPQRKIDLTTHEIGNSPSAGLNADVGAEINVGVPTYVPATVPYVPVATEIVRPPLGSGSLAKNRQQTPQPSDEDDVGKDFGVKEKFVADDPISGKRFTFRRTPPVEEREKYEVPIIYRDEEKMIWATRYQRYVYPTVAKDGKLYRFDAFDGNKYRFVRDLRPEEIAPAPEEIPAPPPEEIPPPPPEIPQEQEVRRRHLTRGQKQVLATGATLPREIPPPAPEEIPQDFFGVLGTEDTLPRKRGSLADSSGHEKRRKSWGKRLLEQAQGIGQWVAGEDTPEPPILAHQVQPIPEGENPDALDRPEIYDILGNRTMSAGDLELLKQSVMRNEVVDPSWEEHLPPILRIHAFANRGGREVAQGILPLATYQQEFRRLILEQDRALMEQHRNLKASTNRNTSLLSLIPALNQAIRQREGILTYLNDDELGRDLLTHARPRGSQKLWHPLSSEPARMVRSNYAKDFMHMARALRIDFRQKHDLPLGDIAHTIPPEKYEKWGIITNGDEYRYDPIRIKGKVDKWVHRSKYHMSDLNNRYAHGQLDSRQFNQIKHEYQFPHLAEVYSGYKEVKRENYMH